MRCCLIFISLLVITKAAPTSENIENSCNDNDEYDKEILKEGLDRPYLLTIDYGTNILYFSYSIPSEEVFKSAYINLNSKEFADIKDVPNGFAQYVDQNTHEVYIGGDDGIYKYDHKTQKSQPIGAKGIDIWMVYYKDLLYYSVYPSQFLYTLVEGESKRFKDLEDTKVDHFIIDNEGLLIYTNETGIFSQKKETKDAMNWAENVSVRGLATDVNGNPFACLNDGIYAFDKKENVLEKIVDVDDSFGLAFDNENNMVYADHSKVVRLRKKNCTAKSN